MRDKNGERWPGAVIFDMDGLMFRTEQQIQRAWDEVGPDFTGERMGYHLLHTMGMNRRLRVEYFAEAYEGRLDFDSFEHAYRSAVSRYIETEGIPLQAGLTELLDFLLEHEIDRMLASGSRRENILRNLDLTGTRKYFGNDRILSGDDVERAKPDPCIYQKSCELLGLEPQEVLVLEDSDNGVVSAYRAGTPVILVPDLLEDTTAVDGMYLARMDSLMEVKEMLADRLGPEK